MEDNKNNKYGMWKATKFMLSVAWKNEKPLIVFYIAITVVAVLLSLVELFVAPVILGSVERQSSVGELIALILGFTAVLIVLNGLKAYLDSAVFAIKIAVRMTVMSMANHKVATMSYPYTEDEGVKKKKAKADSCTGSNGSAAEAIWQNLSDLLMALILFIIYAILLTNVNIIMIVVIGTTCILSYFLGKRINDWGYRHREEQAEYHNKVFYAKGKSDDVSFAKDIRIFGMRQWVDDMYYASISLLHNFKVKGEKQYIKADVIDLLLTFLRNAIAYFYLIGLAIEGSITAAEFLLYFSAVAAFSAMLTSVLKQLNELQKKSIDLSSVLEFIEMEELFKFEDGKHITPDNTKQYEIKLNNVSFKYPEAEDCTLKNINLTLNPGEKIAVVGINGAGKTTLVKLICGLYDPTEGEVLLNGENIKSFNRRDYYKFFTAVFQEFSVLDVTVAENVSQLAENYDLDRVKDCVEKAGLTEKVNSLPGGLKTHIGREVYDDGIELSGGETQRLMLARVLYKDAPIIVLDEPTAALDPLAESDMYSKYNEMAKGRSSVYISHRLASTRFCDRIILIDNGIIAEEGTHEQLVTAGGKYAELYEVQSRYYRKGEDF